MTDQTERGTLLSIFTILFAVLAVSNLLKPLQPLGDETGFVLFGTRLTGTANLIAGRSISAGVRWIPAKAGIQRMDTCFRRACPRLERGYDEEKPSSGSSCI